MKELQSEKKLLRKHILSMRKNLSEAYRKEASSRVAQEIVRSDIFKAAKSIFTFVPFGDEIDIREVIEAAWSEGKVVWAPKSDPKEKRLILYRILRWDELELGHYGILEPRESSIPYHGEEIDLILVPGVAFDEEKGRLGYGGGYYDRFIQQLAPKPYLLAPAFEIQIVSSVPKEPWDLPVQTIVTEKRWIR